MTEDNERNKLTDAVRSETRAWIGARIADLRRRAGLSQEELAERAGLQRSHIARIEGCRYDVTLWVVEAVARALGMTTDIIDPGLKGLDRLKRLT